MSPELSQFIYWAVLCATFTFAVTAVLAVAPKGIDLFTVVVMGIITAIGGGTIRDLILGVPMFWQNDLSYIWVAVAGSIVAFAAASMFSGHIVNSMLLYLDGFGAALFGVLATQKVWAMGYGLPLAPIMLGVVTAIGGGLLRDVLAGRQNLLMTKELYAIPVLLGCTVYALLSRFFPGHEMWHVFVCFGISFSLRAAAIKWKLSVPDWLSTKRIN